MELTDYAELLEQRVQELQSALAEYGEHKAACELELLNAKMRREPREWVCSCGLSALVRES